MGRWWVYGLALVTAICLNADARAQTKQSMNEARERLIREDIRGNGVSNEAVIEAIRNTPRHELVPGHLRSRAYLDMALAIGESQTISSPYIVAFMTEQIDPKPTDRVLEIGTGSGYQAAVLSSLAKEVYTIEIVEALGKKAEQNLKRLKYKNVHVKVGDGFQGWAEHAPFDKIIVTCSPENVPEPLVKQLKEGGRMVIPVGQRYQQMLVLYAKKEGKLVVESHRPTFFVPMTGKAEEQRKVKPDPANPQIANGSFEEFSKEQPTPIAWYYLRQMEVVKLESSPIGRHHALFQNEEPGRPAHALQGFPCDGRAVRQLDLEYRIQCENVRPGETNDQLPILAITFFDERRSPIGEVTTRTWFGSFDWRTDGVRFNVPPKAREASLRIGMFGATGKLRLDAITVSAVRGK